MSNKSMKDKNYGAKQASLAKLGKGIEKEFSNIFSEQYFTRDNVVANREGIKDENFSSLGNMIKSVCFTLQNGVKQKDSYMDTQLKELKGLTESSYIGSDTHEDKIQRKIDFIENLQTSRDEMETVRVAIYNIHVKQLGQVYVPPTKRSATSDVNSSASLQALEMLKQHDLTVSDRQ